MKGVRRVVVVERQGGQSRVETVYERPKTKRKTSGMFKQADRAQKRVLEAQKAFSDQWLDRNERSARKKKDGALRDVVWNFLRAQQKAMDVLFDLD